MAKFQKRIRHFGLLLTALFLVNSRALTQLTTPTIPPCVEQKVESPANMVRPKYPRDALRDGVDASVELHAIVTPEGQTKSLTGPPAENEFARSALRAVGKWHFYPISMEGRPVETTYRVHIHFNSLLQEAVTKFEVESPQPKQPYASYAPEADDTSEGPIHEFSEAGIVVPKVLYQENPEFTDQARQKNESGAVTLSLIVGTSGDPRGIKVLCSSVPDLNDRAIESLGRWKFAAGTKDGSPVPVRIEISTTFHLY